MPLTMTVHNTHLKLKTSSSDQGFMQKEEVSHVKTFTLFHEHLGINEKEGLDYILAYLSSNGRAEGEYGNVNVFDVYRDYYLISSCMPKTHHALSKKIQDNPHFMTVFNQEDTADWVLFVGKNAVLHHQGKLHSTWTLQEFFPDISKQNFINRIDSWKAQHGMKGVDMSLVGEYQTSLPIGEFLFRIAQTWMKNNQDPTWSLFPAQNTISPLFRLAKVLSYIDPKTSKSSLFKDFKVKTWITKSYRYKTRMSARSQREELYIELAEQSLYTIRSLMSPNALPNPQSWNFHDEKGYLESRGSHCLGIEEMVEEFLKSVSIHNTDAEFLDGLRKILK